MNFLKKNIRLAFLSHSYCIIILQWGIYPKMNSAYTDLIRYGSVCWIQEHDFSADIFSWENVFGFGPWNHIPGFCENIADVNVETMTNTRFLFLQYSDSKVHKRMKLRYCMDFELIYHWLHFLSLCEIPNRFKWGHKLSPSRNLSNRLSWRKPTQNHISRLSGMNTCSPQFRHDYLVSVKE